MANELGLKSYIENTLKQRFPSGEEWKSPAFLASQSTQQELERVITISDKLLLRSTRTKPNHAPYRFTDIRTARELFREAVDHLIRQGSHPANNEIEADSRQSSEIIARGEGTPESFHVTLKREQSYRDDLERQSALRNDASHER